jgi:hypothetical protein
MVLGLKIVKALAAAKETMKDVKANTESLGRVLIFSPEEISFHTPTFQEYIEVSISACAIICRNTGIRLFAPSSLFHDSGKQGTFVERIVSQRIRASSLSR